MAQHFVLRASHVVSGQNLGRLASALVVASIVILLLYIGREILEPLVIAALLAFILAPLIRWLRIWGLWRTPAVALTVLAALALIAALGTVMAVQIAQLANDLPKYESNLRAKIRIIGSGPLASSALDRASGTLRDLQNEVAKQGNRLRDEAATGRSAAARTPGA